jgi:hypothetical protein
MTTFPGSPRLQKGALVSIDPANPQRQTIVFQYNPDTMTRRLDARTTGGQDGDRSEALRLTGPPKEAITLSIEIDAADQLEEGDTNTATYGIYPALSTLELLLYPRSDHVTSNLALAQAGNIEIIPPEAPLTVLIWGAQRVLPVRLTSFSITEEAYDPDLNPLRAKVDLTLNVLSYADLKPGTSGFDLFMSHQMAKETMAAMAFGPKSSTSSLKIL